MAAITPPTTIASSRGHLPVRNDRCGHRPTPIDIGGLNVSSIFARRYPASGRAGQPQVVDSGIVVHPSGTGIARSPPAVASSRAGDFVVGWSEARRRDGADDFTGTVVAQRYLADGSKNGAKIVAGTAIQPFEFPMRVSLSANAVGDFVLAAETPNSLAAYRYSAAGAALGPALDVFTTSVSPEIRYQIPAVASDTTGNFVVVSTLVERQNDSDTTGAVGRLYQGP